MADFRNTCSCLRQDSHHPNASAVSKFLAERSAGNAADHSDEPSAEPLLWQKLSRLEFPEETPPELPDSNPQVVEVESATWENLAQSLLSCLTARRPALSKELLPVCQDVELILRKSPIVRNSKQQIIQEPTGMHGPGTSGLCMDVASSRQSEADEEPQGISPTSPELQDKGTTGHVVRFLRTDLQDSLERPPLDPGGRTSHSPEGSSEQLFGSETPKKALAAVAVSAEEDLVVEDLREGKETQLAQAEAEEQHEDASAGAQGGQTLLSPSGKSRGRARLHSDKENAQPQRLSRRLRK